MKNKENKIWDCLLIGAGPASLSAAVYTSRENLETLIVEKAVVGGLAAVTEKIDNYPGFAQGVDGQKLAQELSDQAQRFGAELVMGEVTSIQKEGQIFQVLVDGQTHEARCVLIGTGSDYNRLEIKGEQEFYGRGVHYCATCDGAFYPDQPMVVVGSGNSAAQESLFLTKFASTIDVLIRGPGWKASSVLVDQIAKNPKIRVHTQTQLTELVGQNSRLTKAIGLSQGDRVEFKTPALFVFIGLRPNTGFLEGGSVKLSNDGFVITDDQFKTSWPGVFCAGDVRQGATMQIASAVGEGASAALAIRHYLESL